MTLLDMVDVGSNYILVYAANTHMQLNVYALFIYLRREAI